MFRKTIESDVLVKDEVTGAILNTDIEGLHARRRARDQARIAAALPSKVDQLEMRIVQLESQLAFALAKLGIEIDGSTSSQPRDI